MNKALFLDRDGTINKYGEYIYKPEDFIFIDGAISFIKYFNELGYKVIVVSNQAGIGRGLYTEEDLHKLEAYADSIMAQFGAHIDKWYFCPHHPVHGIGKYKVDCNCRKPKTGMIDRACEEFDIDRKSSIMVGDKVWDYECGCNAGLHSYLLLNENYAELLERIKKDNVLDAPSQ